MDWEKVSTKVRVNFKNLSVNEKYYYKSMNISFYINLWEKN